MSLGIIIQLCRKINSAGLGCSSPIYFKVFRPDPMSGPQEMISLNPWVSCSKFLCLPEILGHMGMAYAYNVICSQHLFGLRLWTTHVFAAS